MFPSDQNFASVLDKTVIRPRRSGVTLVNSLGCSSKGIRRGTSRPIDASDAMYRDFSMRDSLTSMPTRSLVYSMSLSLVTRN